NEIGFCVAQIIAPVSADRAVYRRHFVQNIGQSEFFTRCSEAFRLFGVGCRKHSADDVRSGGAAAFNDAGPWKRAYNLRSAAQDKTLCGNPLFISIVGCCKWPAAAPNPGEAPCP